MGLFNSFKRKSYITMVTERGNGFYSWDGKLYRSDIVRSCIRPQTKALGKLSAKHIRKDNNGIVTNPEPYMRRLLEEPNPLMSFQMLIEKMANQYALNNNAFALIIRDDFGYPCAIYPIPATGTEAVFENGILYLRFYFQNGKQSLFPYSDIIHIRSDFCSNDIFGESPKEALEELMQIVTTIDRGIVKAIKNSSVIRWLLKFSVPMHDDDLKKRVSDFVSNYMSQESETFGAAGVDGKADIQRIEPKDYVPNALLADRNTQRIYSFFNTNDKIVHSNASDDEWNMYFETVIEPIAIQLSNEFTNKLFTVRERAVGNRIYFDASNLNYASFKTKLELSGMVDRGALTPNEWRAAFNLAPVDGGDMPLRRLDTVTVEPTGEGGEKNED